MADYRADYQTTPKAEFQRQLEETDAKVRDVQKKIKELQQQLNCSTDSTTDEAAIRSQFEFLEGFVQSYKTLKRMMKLKDTAIDELYDDLQVTPETNGEDEERKLKQLDQAYAKMIRLLSLYENKSKELLGIPTGWFSSAVFTLQEVVQRNIRKMAGIVVTCSTVGCGFFWVFHSLGCLKCASAWTVAHHAIAGAALGLVFSVVGLLLVGGCYMTYTHYTKKSHLEEAKSAIKNIEDMVEIVKKIPDDDFCDQLDELIVAASCVTDVLPGEEDRMCTICHSRGSDVIRPVKAHGCMGAHYNCEACWNEYVRRGQRPVCTVCRV